MITVSWNVRGVGSTLKRRHVKEVLNELHTDWIGLQETKLSMIDSSIISQLVGWTYFGFAFSSLVDNADGLICFWNLAGFWEECRIC